MAGPWRLRRAGSLDLSGSGECRLEDGQGGDAFGFGTGVAHLVPDADPRRPSVVALLDRATSGRPPEGPAGAEFADGWLMLPTGRRAVPRR
ncbi:hypothetical protein [Kitasatospora indigofera]|uniref:hypothetical protein n=1 Tax=Kitasatospora indigofera TaxID=67307 RepID=UPI0033BD5675